MESSVVVKCDGLVKIYKDQRALDGFSMTINKGDIYGFVGENGSGKTTVIRILSGLIKLNEGEYQLFGVSPNDRDIVDARKRIGAIVEYPQLYPTMTMKDNFNLVGLIVGNSDINEHKRLAELVGLSDLFESKKKVMNFSLGMKQRLGIALALLSNPEFVMLDEPMNGLDPEGIVDVRNLILDLNENNNITFLISSHILSELSLVATRYGIISHGKMLKEISKDELNEYVQPETIINVDMVDEAYNLLYGHYDVMKDKKGVRIIGNIELNPILKIFQDNNINILGINKHEGDIEKYYLSLIGGRNDD